MRGQAYAKASNRAYPNNDSDHFFQFLNKLWLISFNCPSPILCMSIEQEDGWIEMVQCHIALCIKFPVASNTMDANSLELEKFYFLMNRLH